MAHKPINTTHPCLWTTEPFSSTSLSYPAMIPSPVTDELVHLWKVPNRCFWSSPQISFVAPVPTSLKRVAAIRLSRYLQNSLKLMREDIQYIVFVLLSILNMFSNLKLAALTVQYKSLSGKLCDIWHFPPWVLHGLQWLVRLLNYSCRYPTSDSAHKSWSTVCAAFTVWQTSTSWPVSDKVSVGWTWTLIKQVDMAVLRIERENWMAEELWCSIYIFFITSTWLHLNGHLEQSWTRSQPLISSGYKVDGKPSVKLYVACWVFHMSFSCVFWKDKGNMRCW